MDLKHEDLWLQRFAGWVGERFPPAQGILFFALYALALFSGRAFGRSGALAVEARDLAGFLGFYAFFLMLRIFDEHKDYELDCRNHPGRVLQRGLIGLADLKVVCAAAIALQGAVSLWIDGGFGTVTRWWLLVMAMSALMAVEFFAGGYLKPRILLYAASHMLVMPLVVAWAASMGSAETPAAGLALLGTLAYFSGFVFEVGRKVKAPEDERETVDTYSKILGPAGVARAMVILLAVVSALLATLVLRTSDDLPGIVSTAVLTVLLVAGSVATLRFSARATPRRAKLLEAASAATVLAGYVIVTAVLLVERGLRWA